MPDTFPGVARAQVIFENTSALPRDRFVNTFHFNAVGGTVTDAMAASIASDLIAFYNAGPDGVAERIASAVDRGSNKCQVRVYDLGQAEPRVPKTTLWTLDTKTAGSDFPNEVAIVMSYFSVQNRPRKRGRIFIGPLAASASSAGTGDLRVNGSYAAKILTAAQALSTATYAHNHPWHQFSKVQGELSYITDVWVDDAFDTQRRRGLRPSSRQTTHLTIP